MFKSEQIVGVFHWLDRYRKRIMFVFLIPALLTLGVFFKADLVIRIITKPGGLPLSPLVLISDPGIFWRQSNPH